MYISKICINNFRLLKETCISCEKDLSLIIGKNNCGKTSFLSILNKCIGKSTEKFNYFDFSISFQRKLFNVVIGKDSFQKYELQGIRLDIYIEYDESDDLSNLSYLFLDLDPKNNTAILRCDYTLKEEINKVSEDYEKFLKKRTHLKKGESSFSNFMTKKYNKYFEYKNHSVLYDCKKEEANNLVTKLLDKKEIDLSKIISFNYIDARRNVSNLGDTELSSLSAEYYKRTKDKTKDEEVTLIMEENIDKTDDEFTQVYQVVFETLTKKISKYGGIRKNDTNLKIISKLESERLLKDNTTVVYDDDSSYLPENYNGLGYLNLISMIIKIETLLSDFRKDNREDEVPADINVLFIEEPEAHTHRKRFIASVTLKKYRFPERYFPLITSCTYQAIHLTMATVFHRIHSLFRPYA